MGVPLLGRRSGYIQTVYPLLLLPLVSDDNVTICLRKRVGEHVVEGTVLVGSALAGATHHQLPNPLKLPSKPMFGSALNAPSSKTSPSASGSRSTLAARPSYPAVNDPYTAVQAIDHLAVVCCDLAVRPLGTKIITGPGGRGPRGDTRKQLRRLRLLHRRAFWALRLERSRCDVGVASLVRDRCRGASARAARLPVMDRAAAEALADAERSMPRPPSWSESGEPTAAPEQDQLPQPPETHPRCLTADSAATRQAGTHGGTVRGSIGHHPRWTGPRPHEDSVVVGPWTACATVTTAPATFALPLAAPAVIAVADGLVGTLQVKWRAAWWCKRWPGSRRSSTMRTPYARR